MAPATATAQSVSGGERRAGGLPTTSNYRMGRSRVRASGGCREVTPNTQRISPDQRAKRPFIRVRADFAPTDKTRAEIDLPTTM
jgi:hypothetical protein